MKALILFLTLALSNLRVALSRSGLEAAQEPQRLRKRVYSYSYGGTPMPVGSPALRQTFSWALQEHARDRHPRPQSASAPEGPHRSSSETHTDTHAENHGSSPEVHGGSHSGALTDTHGHLGPFSVFRLGESSHEENSSPRHQALYSRPVSQRGGSRPPPEGGGRAHDNPEYFSLTKLPLLPSKESEQIRAAQHRDIKSAPASEQTVERSGGGALWEKMPKTPRQGGVGTEQRGSSSRRLRDQREND